MDPKINRHFSKESILSSIRSRLLSVDSYEKHPITILYKNVTQLDLAGFHSRSSLKTVIVRNYDAFVLLNGNCMQILESATGLLFVVKLRAQFPFLLLFRKMANIRSHWLSQNCSCGCLLKLLGNWSRVCSKLENYCTAMSSCLETQLMHEDSKNKDEIKIGEKLGKFSVT